jgi:hypothetical protein
MSEEQLREAGGPAFPQKLPSGMFFVRSWHGVSARDFAAAALTGMLAADGRLPDAADAAGAAYEYADAMLAARNKKGGSR